MECSDFLNPIVYMPMLDKVYSVVEVNKIISVEKLGQHIILDLYMSKRRLGCNDEAVVGGVQSEVQICKPRCDGQ